MLPLLRESFAAKILAALAGTVTVLVAVTFAVVRSETARQVEAATERAVEEAARQSQALQDIQRQQVARVARPLTEGRRTLAALDEAIAAGDEELLAGLAGYEMDLAELTEALVAFTDARGEPVLTLHDGRAMEDRDPAGVGPLARAVLDGSTGEAEGYRVVEGTLYSVRTRLIQLAGRPIGTLSLGLPLTDEEVGRIAELAGAEVCFVVDGRCAAGSVAAQGPVTELLTQAAGDGMEARVSAAGTRWSVRAEPLVAGEPARGWRVVAVPLDPVLAPFRRIGRALLVGGLGALVLALLVGWALSRGLTRPVRALAAATERVARGDLEVQVPERSRDEVGRLAGAFNRMTRDLRLKEEYRSVLDKVVSPEVARQLVEGGVELGGENRRVTVLFADVRGFTALTREMAPQDVIGLLNECMQRLSEAVEAEGGVVDKYVGDEVMAVFGAPVAQADHAARAVRAAVRMQRAVAELNAHRAGRGEPALEVGVGLNTGEVVAGNMGSVDRLNYTVLGSPVNLAARVCAAAGPGEILVTGAVVEEAGDPGRFRERGSRSFKGVGREVPVYAVEAAAEARSGPGGGPGTVAGTAVALALGLALTAGPALGQVRDGGWPTLAGAGAGWISADGTFQVDLSGRLDVEGFLHGASHASPADVTALVRGDGAWMAPRLRLFTDLFAGDHLYGFVEVRADRGHGPAEGSGELRLEQAFVRLHEPGGRAGIQVGRFASPFGSYPARHLGPVDPFVRPPLFYDYRTVICPGILPPDAPRFIGWKDRPGDFRPVGAPPVWGVPYQWGAMASGRVGRFGWRLAAVNSAPSSPPEAWAWDAERMRHPSWVAGLDAEVSPALTVGASWSRGPYLEPVSRGSFPEGETEAGNRFDYVQEIASVHAAWLRGPFMVRAEAVRDRWEVPNVADDPVEHGYSLEVQADVAAGLFVSGRAGLLDFRPLRDGLGAASPYPEGEVDWDDDVARWEVGVGWRWARNAGVLASASVTDQVGDLDAADDLLALRLWWAF